MTADKERDLELDLERGGTARANDPASPPADILGEVLIRSARESLPDDRAPGLLFPPTEEDEPAALPGPPEPAPLSARARALLADATICLLLAAASLLGGAVAGGRFPGPRSLIWCGLFAALLSFFLTVPTLALFGRTPGMALADLSADDATGEKPTVAASAIRWLMTLATLLLAGIPLLTFFVGGRRETPADRLSGRPLRLLRAEPSR